MKYHIDTIPIWDAFKLESECPLCVIKRHFELQECEKFLGASVMDPDTRIRV
ncbi:MAG: ABC transporter substrate-binding protein, partial [Christensenellaceae bacterium]|nr:ABC transporter substrate-binding protein [Christensenellaceae bacterium]